MRVLYNQFHVLREGKESTLGLREKDDKGEGSVTFEPESRDFLNAVNEDGVLINQLQNMTEEQIQDAYTNAADMKGREGSQLRHYYRTGKQNPTDLPDLNKGELMGYIPGFDDVELDYFGLGKEAGEYNLPLIDSNLRRGIDVGTPAARELTRSSVALHQSTMDTLLPGHQGLINQSTRRAQQNMAGILGPQAESAIARAGAYRGMQSGIGFGGRSSNLTARDLGLSAYEMSNVGFAQSQMLYDQSSQIAMDLMVRPGDLAMQLMASYNQGSMVTPELAIKGEGVNIASKFNIAEQQIGVATTAYEAEYQKTSDTIAFQEAQETRRYEARQAAKARKSNLLSSIIGGVATIAGAAVTGGLSLALPAIAGVAAPAIAGMGGGGSGGALRSAQSVFRGGSALTPDVVKIAPQNAWGAAPLTTPSHISTSPFSTTGL